MHIEKYNPVIIHLLQMLKIEMMKWDFVALDGFCGLVLEVADLCPIPCLDALLTGFLCSHCRFQ